MMKKMNVNIQVTLFVAQQRNFAMITQWAFKRSSNYNLLHSGPNRELLQNFKKDEAVYNFHTANKSIADEIEKIRKDKNYLKRSNIQISADSNDLKIKPVKEQKDLPWWIQREMSGIGSFTQKRNNNILWLHHYFSWTGVNYFLGILFWIYIFGPIYKYMTFRGIHDLIAFDRIPDEFRKD